MLQQRLGLRNPDEIAVAGGALRELMSERTEPQVVRAELLWDPDDLLCDDDEVWRFRTPPWTWQQMSGVDGYGVIRRGLAAHWLVKRMN